MMVSILYYIVIFATSSYYFPIVPIQIRIDRCVTMIFLTEGTYRSIYCIYVHMQTYLQTPISWDSEPGGPNFPGMDSEEARNDGRRHIKPPTLGQLFGRFFHRFIHRRGRFNGGVQIVGSPFWHTNCSISTRLPNRSQHSNQPAAD